MRTLLRHFAFRFVDNDLVAADGEAHQVAANALGICGGLGFTLSVLHAVKYTFGQGDRKFEAVRHIVVWMDQELLIGLAMLVAALATALSWDSLLPDRRDCLVLGPLPVKTSRMFLAKLASILLVIFLVVGMTMAFPSLTLPGIAEGMKGSLPAVGLGIVVQWAIVLMAGGLVFFTFLSLQTLLLHLLPYRMYLAVAPVVQVALLLGSLATFLLIPNLEQLRRTGSAMGWYFPPMWFLALQQAWTGKPQPIDAALAPLAWQAFAGVTSFALILYAAGFRRAMRKAVEGADLSGSGRGWFGRLLQAALNSTILRHPKERAVFWFTARSLARNRKHRLLLSVYFAGAFSYVIWGLQHDVRPGGSHGILLPSPAQLTVPIDFALFILIGLRVLFALPVELRSNWIFRITESGAPTRYLAGIRKFLWSSSVVPLVALPLPVYAAVWGWKIALIHTAFLILLALLLVERLLWRFAKIPFTCSYLPGKANLKVKLGAYFAMFIALSSFLAAIELTMLRSETGWIKVLLVLAALLTFVVWRRRRHELALEGFLYEESGAWWMATLDLKR